MFSWAKYVPNHPYNLGHGHKQNIQGYIYRLTYIGTCVAYMDVWMMNNFVHQICLHLKTKTKL